MPKQSAEETHLQDVRYSCPNCGFENYIAGYCPNCEEDYLRKVCECRSGKYAATCCEPELEAIEAEMKAKAEHDAAKDTTQELKQEIHAEIAEEKAEDSLFKEAKEESKDLED